MANIFWGYFFKGLSILSRVYFIFYISSSFIEGEFAKYYFLFTVSLIVSRVFGLGASDTLPSVLDHQKEHKDLISTTWYLQFFIVFIALILCAEKNSFSNDMIGVLSVIVLSLSLYISQIAGGIIRVRSPVLFELSNNLPWMVYIVWVFLFPPLDSYSVILGLAVFFGLSNIYVLFKYQKNFPKFHLSIKLYSVVYAEWRTGFYRFSSGVSQVFLIRAYILIAGASAGASLKGLDGMTFSLAVAEAVWQICMILPNRFYSQYVLHPHLVKSGLTSNLLYVFFISCTLFIGATGFIYGLFFLNLSYLKNLDLYYFVLSSLSLISVICWTFMKYALWSRKDDQFSFKCELVSVAVVLLLCLLGCDYYVVVAGTGVVLFLNVFIARARLLK